MPATSGTAAREANRAKRRSRPRVPFGSFRFYLAVIVVALCLHGFNAILSNIPFAEPVPDREVAIEFQKKQFDTWAEMNKLLITLATLTIGAVGGFMLHRDKTSALPARAMRRAAASWLFCALSLYFGYLSYHEATLLLSLGAFNLYFARLWWPMHAQFWAFLIAVILLADFVYGSIREGKGASE